MRAFVAWEDLTDGAWEEVGHLGREGGREGGREKGREGRDELGKEQIGE